MSGFHKSGSRLEVCSFLLEQCKESIAVQAEDWEGYTAAHIAVKEGHSNICSLLASRIAHR
eukprot:629359-Amphidinium_carterae.1